MNRPAVRAYAHLVRAVVFDMADPAFPASLVDLPEPDLPSRSWARIAVVDRRDLRQRPPPLRAQHRAVAHLGLHRHVSLRPGARDRRPRGRGRCGLQRQRGDEGGARPVHPVPATRNRPTLRQLRPRVDFVVPEPRQPHRQFGTFAGLHPGSRRWLGRIRAGPRVDDPPAPRHDRGPRCQPLRTGLHRLPRPHARHAGRRRARAHRRRRHHRTGRARRAAWAVPGVGGDGAGPSCAPGRRRRSLWRRSRRVERSRQRPLGGAGVALRVAGGRSQAAPDAHGRVPLRRGGGGVTRNR